MKSTRQLFTSVTKRFSPLCDKLSLVDTPALAATKDGDDESDS